MNFIAKASTEEEYQKWLHEAKQSTKELDLAGYSKLAAPSENNAPEIYQLQDDTLFDQILMKYMHPPKQ
jgi:cytochrome o ubiquinol oxidase subunit 2